MAEVYNNYNSVNRIVQPPNENELSQYNIEAHTSSNMKVERPKLVPAEAPSVIPTTHLFSDADATKRMQSINTDIYEGSKKEKSKHEFNRSLYFKIFGGVLFATAGVAGISRIKKWFGK